MSDKKINTPSEIVILDGVTYKRENLDIPFSGIYNWIAEDGTLVMSTEFKDGKKNGESIVYNSDGSVSYREYFINDIKQTQ